MFEYQVSQPVLISVCKDEISLCRSEFSKFGTCTGSDIWNPFGEDCWSACKVLCCEFRIICSNHETTNYSHTDQYTLTGIYTQVYVQNIRE